MAYTGRNSYERGYNPVPPPPRGRGAGSSTGYANESLNLHTTQTPPTLTPGHATAPTYNGPSMPLATDKISPVSPSSRSPRYKDTTDAHNRFHRGSSTFDQIRMDCLRKGIMYEDIDFPANDQSLYYSRNPPVKFEWKRPTVIIIFFAFHIYKFLFFCLYWQ
ncbi:hypothetical protein ACJMK2_037771 [Sinanodonta woodiana]|uniref:Calpain catalytic domain-containing protein n=1 Tax=Sinanodonta woodiana TaxID=1069815 RepID=A0ABD3WLG1_SINWO